MIAPAPLTWQGIRRTAGELADCRPRDIRRRLGRLISKISKLPTKNIIFKITDFPSSDSTVLEDPKTLPKVCLPLPKTSLSEDSSRPSLNALNAFHYCTGFSVRTEDASVWVAVSYDQSQRLL